MAVHEGNSSAYSVSMQVIPSLRVHQLGNSLGQMCLLFRYSVVIKIWEKYTCHVLYINTYAHTITNNQHTHTGKGLVQPREVCCYVHHARRWRPPLLS